MRAEARPYHPGEFVSIGFLIRGREEVVLFFVLFGLGVLGRGWDGNGGNGMELTGGGGEMLTGSDYGYFDVGVEGGVIGGERDGFKGRHFDKGCLGILISADGKRVAKARRDI